MPIQNTQKRGRPAKLKTAVKSEVLGLRFTTSEKTRLEHTAQSAGKNLSQWAKGILLGHSDSMREIAVSKATKISQGSPHMQIPSQQRSGASLSIQAADLNNYMSDVEKFVRSTKSVSTKESILFLHTLIQMNRRFSKYLRMAALNTQTIAAISALYEDCVDTCHFLAKPYIVSKVRAVARQRASFPVVAYAQPLLNNRVRTLLNKVMPGAELHGLRKEAKWIDSPFVHEVLQLLDHTDALFFDLTMPPEELSQCECLIGEPLPARIMPKAKKFVRLYKCASSMNGTQEDLNELWCIIENIIIGKDDSGRFNLFYRYAYSWEEIYNIESLSMVDGVILEKKKIKDKIKRAFLTLFPVLHSYTNKFCHRRIGHAKPCSNVLGAEPLPV